jgi:PKD repeat protein
VPDGGGTISFTSTSTGKINSYAWNFDDQGATSSAKNPSHNFPSDAGNFTVRLKVTGPGGSDTVYKRVVVCT